MTGIDKLEADLRGLGLQEYAATLAAEARDSFRMVPLTDDVAQLGQSKFGGEPDLPVGLDWPVRPALTEADIHDGVSDEMKAYLSAPQPMSLVLQVNLAEVPDPQAALPGLPDKGHLFLFYDTIWQPWGYEPSHDRGFAVIHAAPDTVLQRGTPPIFDPLVGPLTEFPIGFYPETSRIPVSSARFSALGLPYDVVTAYDEALDDLEDSGLPDQFGGWPSPIQGEMEAECALVANGISAGDPAQYHSDRGRAAIASQTDWRLLCQIASDDDREWGDGGQLYVWIRETDLTNRDFSKARVILQCF
ncbi:DUF1963 domain-containing protein [Mameliella alba]|nr:DUF1963 domain-containing protein [Antarctobacter heliothermus]MBY6145935.1 DUF1963 domain-containing protein [Mameliella alba]MCA0954648.1 DUF1963 domain-containing protein [Mameliella alba]